MTESQRLEAVEAAGEAYLDGIEEHLDAGKSPVSGGKYRSKLKDGGISQLFETGSMRDSIRYEPHQTGGQITGLKIGIFEDASEVDKVKSLGHNTGFKGHPNERKLKKYQREFIPGAKKNFKRAIQAEANSAVDDIRQEQADLEIESLETNEGIGAFAGLSESALDSLIARVISGEI